MRAALLAFLLVLFAALAASQIVTPNDHYKICSGPDASVVVHNLTVEPFPPKIGGSVRIAFNADLTAPVDAGSTVSVNLRFGIITIIDDTYDLCSMYPGCPIEPTNIDFDQTIPIPSIIPGGRYRALIQAFDQNKREIVCVDVDVELRRGDEEY